MFPHKKPKMLSGRTAVSLTTANEQLANKREIRNALSMMNTVFAKTVELQHRKIHVRNNKVPTNH